MSIWTLATSPCNSHALIYTRLDFPVFLLTLPPVLKAPALQRGDELMPKHKLLSIYSRKHDTAYRIKAPINTPPPFSLHMKSRNFCISHFLLSPHHLCMLRREGKNWSVEIVHKKNPSKTNLKILPYRSRPDLFEKVRIGLKQNKVFHILQPTCLLDLHRAAEILYPEETVTVTPLSVNSLCNGTLPSAGTKQEPWPIHHAGLSLKATPTQHHPS